MEHEDENLINDRFIPYWPDKILDLFETGALSLNAYHIYMYLRLKADTRGKVTTSFEDINKVLFEARKDRSTINKYFLSLKEHTLLVYPMRKGKRKAIIIHFTDFFDPKAKNKNGRYALVNQKYIKSPDSCGSKSHVMPITSIENHRLETIDSVTTLGSSPDTEKDNFTTPNNDNNNEKENKSNNNDNNKITSNEEGMASIRKIMEERKNKKSI